MESLLTKILHRPVAAGMVCLALLVGGMHGFTRMPLNLAPSIEFPAVSIRAVWPGASPETVEQVLTAPMEEIAATIRGTRRTSSLSREGVATLTVEFEPGTALNLARLELNERLATFSEDLPPDASFLLLQPYVPEEFRFLQGFLSYALAGGASQGALRRHAEELVLPRIKAVRGVGPVELVGGEVREIRIGLDPLRSAALEITEDTLRARFEAIGATVSVGSFISGDERRVLTVRSDLMSCEDIRNMPVAWRPGGSPILLNEVGTVKDTLAEPVSIARINGRSSVAITIGKEPTANALRVADEVYATIAEAARALPHGIAIIKESDRTELMRHELQSLFRNTVAAFMLIGVFLVLLTGTIRAPAILVSGIFISIAGTLLVLWLCGVSLHVLSLAGIVLGVGRLSGDAIVVLDSIQRHSAAGGSAFGTARAVGGIAVPMTFSTLATAGALLPVALLPEELRLFLGEVGLAVGISLLMSLLVSFFLVPLMANLAGGQDEVAPWRERLDERMNVAYRRILAFGLRRRRLVLGGAILLFGLPVWLLPERITAGGWAATVYNAAAGSEVGRRLRPVFPMLLGGVSYHFFTGVAIGDVWREGHETFLSVHAFLPPGADMRRYDEIAATVEREVAVHPAGVAKITTHVDRDFATSRIDFDDAADGTDVPVAMKRWLCLLAARTGGASVLVSGFGPGLSVGGNTGSTFRVKVLGYNFDTVRKIAARFRRALEQNPRIAEVTTDFAGGTRGSYEIVLVIDRDALTDHGLEAVEVMQALALRAQSLATLKTDREGGTVQVRHARETTVEDLMATVVNAADGHPVRIGDLVRVERRSTSPDIVREQQQYIRWIGFEYRGPSEHAERAIDRAIAAFPLPAGYRVERRGSDRSFNERERTSMLDTAIMALVILFMVTASFTESIVKPLVVMLSVPLPLIGAFLAFIVTGLPFGIGGFAALMMLIGIAGGHATLLVDAMSRGLTGKEGRLDILIDAAASRVRPVMLTAAATLGGCIPMVAAGDEASVWYSLAVGIIGGVASSTLLTPLVVPVIYRSVCGVR